MFRHDWVHIVMFNIILTKVRLYRWMLQSRMKRGEF